MRRTEIIVGGLAISAFILNLFFLFPGSGALSILFLSILWLIYCFFGFALLNNLKFRTIGKKKAYANVSRKKIIGATGAGIALSMVVLGILYKIMMWPGTTFMLQTGLGCLTVVLVVSFLKYSDSQAVLYTNIFKRSLIIGTIGLCLFLIPRDNYLEFKYRNHPGYVKAMKNVWQDPSNLDFQKALYQERIKLSQPKSK